MLSQLDHHALAKEFKIRASLLHKKIKQLSLEAVPSKEQVFEMATRLKKLPQWEKYQPMDLFVEFKSVQLKHCLHFLELRLLYLLWFYKLY